MIRQKKIFLVKYKDFLLNQIIKLSLDKNQVCETRVWTSILYSLENLMIKFN